MIRKARAGGTEPTGHHPSASQKRRSNISSIRSQQPAPRDILTPRERAVLAQIARGASSKEIGRQLGVSARTIEFHRANIRRKLGAKNIVDLLILALRNGGKL